MTTPGESELDALIDRGAALRGISVEERAGGLAAAAARWFAGERGRRESVALLSRETGYSEPVVAAGLDRLFAAVTTPELLKWWERRNRTGTAVRAVLIVSAGNIPGVSLFPAMGCLLAGVPVMIKSATAEPVSAPMWHGLLRQAAPRLADSVICATWRGGDVTFEDALFGRFDRILAYGRDETVEDLSRRYAGRISGYGTGISIAVVGDVTSHLAGAARHLALDVAIWDQQGCLSPHFAFVTGDFRTAADFGERTAAALNEIQVDLPRGRLTLPEAAAIRTFRARAEARMASGDPVKLWTPDPSRARTDWTVTVDADATFAPPLANRTIQIKPLKRLEDLPAALASWRGRLQGAGLGPGIDAGQAFAILRRVDVTHVVPLGTMQAPAVGWLNRGRDLLDDLFQTGDEGRPG